MGSNKNVYKGLDHKIFQTQGTKQNEISLFEELNVIQKDLERNPNNCSLKLKRHSIKQEH